MLNWLKRLPVVDETWECFGRHPRSGKKQALLVWRCGGVLYDSVVDASSTTAHARALEQLFEKNRLRAVGRRIQVESAELSATLGRMLAPLGVEVTVRGGMRPLDVERFAADVILERVVRMAAPRWTSQSSLDRFGANLSVLRLDEAWLRLPLNLSLLVEGLESQPFGMLVHADCCPGFTVLPLDEDLLVPGREGIITLRLPRSEMLGMPGRWPIIVEEHHAQPPRDVFSKQRPLSVHAMERVEPAMEILVELAGTAIQEPREMTLRRSVQCPIEVRLEPLDLGVRSFVVPFPWGEQHVRVRAA